MARKTKEALIEEARDLELEVDEDENYNVIQERVSTAREAQARETEAEEEARESVRVDEVEVDASEEAEAVSDGSRVCANCGRPAVTTDDAGGRANPVDFCAVHAPTA